MITKVTIATSIDQEIEVHRNWEGDEEKTVHIQVFEDTDEKNEKPYSIYVTIQELENLVKAAKLITDSVKDEKSGDQGI